ncbi:MAG TPA: Rrf2 family transcriptional regulator, partial [Pirellulales bacterium]
SRLAETGHMPERFLLQILRNLVTHGLLRSTRGVEGGYTLVREPEDISLLDLIEAIDGPMVSALPREEGLTPDVLSKLQTVMGDVTTNLRRELSQIKLADFLQKSENSAMI